MMNEREEKSQDIELKVNSFDNKLASHKNMIMQEITHTKDNLLQEPKKIMRDFEINVKHIYDMKFKSLETQFIGIMDEQAKLNRLTQQDFNKRQEENAEYYNKVERIVQQNVERQEQKMKVIIDDILSKFNKMEDTFLELFKQKEKLFERMNFGYEILFSNQEIMESTVKKIIYTLDRKADNLSVRTYLKNVKLDIDTKIEDFQNSVGYSNPLKGGTSTYHQDRNNQSGILENINTLNMSEQKQLDGENSVPKLLNKLNMQAKLLKTLRDTQEEQEKKIDHLEEISMNFKMMDHNSHMGQLLSSLKQRVPISTKEDISSHTHSINLTPLSQKNKSDMRNYSPQIDNTFYQNLATDSKSIHQRSDYKDKEQNQANKQGNYLMNDIFNKKQTDLPQQYSNNQHISRNLIYEAFDQSSSPQINRAQDIQGQGYIEGGNKINILQNNFVAPSSNQQKEKNENIPQCLELDEAEQVNSSKRNVIDDLDRLKLSKSIAQDRMTSTSIPNRMRQNFDQKQKQKQKDLPSKVSQKKDDSDILKEAQPLDQGFIDADEDVLTNSLKKQMTNKNEDDNPRQQGNNQNKKQQQSINDKESKNKNNQMQFNQTISHSPREDEEDDDGAISGGGLRGLLNKSKKRSDISREPSPIQNNQQQSQINNSTLHRHQNEISLLNQDYNKSQLSNNSSYLHKSQYNQNQQQNIPNYLQKSSYLDNKSTLNKNQMNQGNSYGRQGEYYDSMNQDVFENPLDRKKALPKKNDLSNSSLLRNNKSQQNFQQQKQNDLPPLNIKSQKEISRKPDPFNKGGLQQRNNLNKGFNQQNNRMGNQYQNRGGMFEQNNNQYDEDEEVVYQIDEDGFLMDEQGEYLRDEQGNFIRLSPDQLDNLRDQNLVVEEDMY